MMNWQPIDTAPKDGTRILLFFPTFRSMNVQIGSWSHSQHYDNGKLTHESARWWYGSTVGLWGGKESEPTHWMPIPEGPVSS